MMLESVEPLTFHQITFWLIYRNVIGVYSSAIYLIPPCYFPCHLSEDFRDERKALYE